MKILVSVKRVVDFNVKVSAKGAATISEFWGTLQTS